MTPFQQTLVVLVWVRNSVERCVLSAYSVNGTNLSAREDRLADPNFCFLLQNHLQILISSFLVEWPRFVSYAKSDLRIREMLRQLKPVTDRFNGWSDLRSVRSKILAHPFRDKQGGIVSPWEVFRESKSPTTLAETLLLAFCVCMVVDRLKARHSGDVAEIDGVIQSMDRTVPAKGIELARDLEIALAALQASLAATKDNGSDGK
jgi:hypothetical protein